MGLDIYWIGLLVLVPIVAIVAGHETILSSSLLRGIAAITTTATTTSEKRGETDPIDDEARAFRRTFLRVYLLVIGSEWLQVSKQASELAGPLNSY